MAALGKIATLVVLGPIAILVVGIGGCEVHKAYYDWQVRKLCEKDGGVRVYERLSVSTETFASRGGDGGVMSLPDESERQRDVSAFQRVSSKVIKSGYVSIVRYETQVVRWSDSKVMGRLVIYSRSGGDFPFTASAPSYYQCPEGNNDVVRQVLEIQRRAR